MTNKITFGKSFNLLEQAMQVAHRRHSLLTSNISNLDTPHYKARDVDFKSAMARAVKANSRVGLTGTHPGHMGLGPDAAADLDVFEEKGQWNGFNYMNSDEQITKMTENNLIYRTASEALLRKIAIMKEIIREGGR